MASADLRGVAKRWFSNDAIKSRLEEGGIGSIIVTAKSNPIAGRDQKHSIWNSDILIPIMENMASNHLIKTPDMPTIEAQVHILNLLHLKKAFDANDLPPIDDLYEVPIHLVVTSIKKMVGFVRSKFLRLHKPRDSGWVKEREKKRGYEFFIFACMFKQKMKNKINMLYGFAIQP